MLQEDTHEKVAPDIVGGVCLYDTHVIFARIVLELHIQSYARTIHGVWYDCIDQETEVRASFLPSPYGKDYHAIIRLQLNSPELPVVREEPSSYRYILPSVSLRVL